MKAGGAWVGPAAEPVADLTLHASCVVLGENGVLIRGEAGAGKSRLCLDLLEAARREGRFAGLVGDDRIRLCVRHGRLVARPHPAIAGLIEIRGAGLHRLARTVRAALVRLVVDLEEAGERLPAETPARVGIAGLTFPLLRLERTQPREYLIRQALAALPNALEAVSWDGWRASGQFQPLA